MKGEIIINDNKNIVSPKKAPLVYINRLKMIELKNDKNNFKNEYKFVPTIKDEKGKEVSINLLTTEEKKKYKKSISSKIARDGNKHMILTAESELIRIIKHLSERNEKKKKKISGQTKERDYIPDILSLKVGKSYSGYRDVMKKNNMTVTYNGITYKRIVVSSSHSRTQKAMLVSEDVWDKAMDILLCGLDRDLMFQYMSKWNSYIGLAATDSIPVTKPNIVVIEDCEMPIHDTFDPVYEKDMLDEDNKIKRNFSVKRDQERDEKTNLFDGAGLVTVNMAKSWSKELGLDYIPASFQFRAIPCLKGKLYTMPVEEFAREKGTSRIVDIKGKEFDLFKDNIDCILTKSQFKFHNLYEKIKDWENEFNTPTHGYTRTFNICEYDCKCSDLKDTTVMAYQPLQTLDLDKNRIKRVSKKTVKSFKYACQSVEGFLAYRGICGESDDEDEIEWSKYPTYYKAMYYNHSLFNDAFVKEKIKQDLKSGKERAFVGKLIVNGNYQTVVSDLYALMQHAFGLEVTGLLKADQVYSNYWNLHLEETPYIDIIRSPHIAMEHCPSTVVTSAAMEKWFKYQKTGIILSAFGNTTALKLNSCDFDGDHVLTTNDSVICETAMEQRCNTICHVKEGDVKAENLVSVGDVDAIIECDYKGYKNNIGNIINPISKLWSLEQTEQIQDYIKIMSIVGSITIDYAKHGEESNIPDNIKKLLNQHKKPYFMKYLPGGRGNRSKEKEMRSTSDLFPYNEKEYPFENTDCTMNRICHYMEEQIGKEYSEIEVTDKFDVFQFLSSKIDTTTHKYSKIRATLIDLQEQYNDISNENFKDEDSSKTESEDNSKKYDALYDMASSALLSVESNVSNLIDTLLTIYYTDKKFMEKYSDKSILWGCFGEYMVERAKGNFTRSNDIDFEELRRRKEKADKYIADLKAYREDNFIIYDFENKKIKNDEGNTEYCHTKANIYKEDISWIKEMIPTKIKYSCQCRRLLLVLMYASRKCNSDQIQLMYNKNNRITQSALCKLADIDKRNFQKYMLTLNELGITETFKNSNRPIIRLLKCNDKYSCIYKEDIHYRQLKTVVKEKIREKATKTVKENCT